MDRDLGAHRRHPGQRHRRRRGGRRAVRAAPGDVRRLHRVGPLADVHRGLHPRRGPAALRQHPHRVIGDRPPDDPVPRGRAADHPRRGRRRRATSTSCSSPARARPARSTSSSTCLEIRLPADLDDRYDLARLDPGRRAAGRVHRAVRAPLQRAALARVDRRRRRDPRGPRRADRPGAARGASSSRYADRPLKIGSFSAASNVTGIISDVRGDLGPAPPPRRAVVLGLRGGGARTSRSRWARRRDGGGPNDPLAYKDAIFISPHKFIGGPGHARGARRPPGAVPQPRPVGARRRHGRLRQPVRARLPRRTSSTARRAARRRSSSRSGPASCSSSRRRSAPTRSASARSRSSTARSSAGRATRTSRSSATRRSIGCRSCRSSSGCRTPERAGWARRPPLPPPQLRRRAAQRPVRDPVARRLLVRRAVRPPVARHRPRHEPRVRARDRPRLRGDQAGLGAGELQLLHQRAGVRVHPRGRRARGDRRLAAAPPLPVRAGDRAVAARRRDGRAAA